MATTSSSHPDTASAAAECAFAIFGSDIPPITPDDTDGWPAALAAIADEWADGTDITRRATRVTNAVNEVDALRKLFGTASAPARAAEARLRLLLERCRRSGITTAELLRHGAPLPVLAA